MNKMERVADILGVKLGCEFNIIYSNGEFSVYNPHMLTEDGLKNCMGQTSDFALTQMLIGEASILLNY